MERLVILQLQDCMCKTSTRLIVQGEHLKKMVELHVRDMYMHMHMYMYMHMHMYMYMHMHMHTKCTLQLKSFVGQNFTQPSRKFSQIFANAI